MTALIVASFLVVQTATGLQKSPPATESSDAHALSVPLFATSSQSDGDSTPTEHHSSDASAQNTETTIARLTSEVRRGNTTALVKLGHLGPPGQRALATAIADAARVDQLRQPFTDVIRHTESSTLLWGLNAIAENSSYPIPNRAFACAVLGDAQGAMLIPANHFLLELSKIPDVQIAETAHESLVRSTKPTAFDALSALHLSPPDPFIKASLRTWSLQALTTIGDATRDSVRILVADGRQVPQKELPDLIETLGQLKDTFAIPFLTELLSSRNWRIVIAATNALGNFGNRANAALPTLISIEHSHWLPIVRKVAAIARDEIVANAIVSPIAHGSAATNNSIGVVSGRCQSEPHPEPEGWIALDALVSNRLSRTTNQLVQNISIDPSNGSFATAIANDQLKDIPLLIRTEDSFAAENTTIAAIVKRPWAVVAIYPSGPYATDFQLTTVDMSEKGILRLHPLLSLPGSPESFRIDGTRLTVATAGGTVGVSIGKPTVMFKCKQAPLAAMWNSPPSYPRSFRQTLPSAIAAPIERLRKSCATRSPGSCVQLAIRYQLGLGVSPNELEAFRLFYDACIDHEAVACTQLAYLLKAGRKIVTDDGQASIFFRQGCDWGDSAACLVLARIYRLQSNLWGNSTALRELFTNQLRACHGGENNRCAELGLMYKSGHGVKPNLRRALTIFRDACDQGNPASCTQLGIMYQMGQATLAKPNEASILFERACQQNEAIACTNMGLLYKRGQGMPKNSAKAIELFRKACLGFEPVGCVELSRMYRL